MRCVREESRSDEEKFAAPAASHLRRPDAALGHTGSWCVRRSRIRSNSHSAFEVTVGKPAKQILHVALEEGADLIVMSTQGLTGARRLFFGSTTERVLRETTRSGRCMAGQIGHTRAVPRGCVRKHPRTPRCSAGKPAYQRPTPTPGRAAQHTCVGQHASQAGRVVSLLLPFRFDQDDKRVDRHHDEECADDHQRPSE